MSRNDRLKEELGWLKIVFAVLVAVDVSLIGWVVENYQSAAFLHLVVAFAAAMIAIVAIVWVNRAALRRFKALEDE